MSILPDPGSEPITPGKSVELTCEFKDDGGKPDEPGSVDLYIRWPGQKLGEGEKVGATKKGAAIWAFSFVADKAKAGRAHFYWYGNGVSADKGSFVIGSTGV